MLKRGYSSFFSPESKAIIIIIISASSLFFIFFCLTSLRPPLFSLQRVQPCKSLSVLLRGRQAAIRGKMTVFFLLSLSPTIQNRARDDYLLRAFNCILNCDLQKGKMFSYWRLSIFFPHLNNRNNCIDFPEKKVNNSNPGKDIVSHQSIPEKYYMINTRILRLISDDRGQQFRDQYLILD